MPKKRITTQKKEQISQKNKRSVEKLWNDEEFSDVSIKFAKAKFLLDQMEKGNSKATIAFYERFFIKFEKFLATWSLDDEASISWLTADATLLGFKAFMSDVKEQTVNSYLRAYRAFGNYCQDCGLIDGFYCPVKEVDPPAKQVYSDNELRKLLVKPDIRDFEEFRNYTIINIILATGARSNTILNIHLEDVDLEEGYILFNTTKAHKVVRIGLDRKSKLVLTEYINNWRTGGDIEPKDFLFCNNYGEQLTRSGLTSAIKKYNLRRGVEKTSIHLLRHTFAKNWITSGGDLITLSKVLTHSELDMVKRYSNLYSYDVKAEIEEHSTLSKLRTNSGKTLTTQKREDND